MNMLNINEIKKSAIKIIEPDFSYVNGAYLRKFRMEMKMSQALLADYLGVSKKAIEKWEQGKNKINPVVARMVYLIEHDTKILSVLKQVKIGDTVFDLKKSTIFEVNVITNDNEVKSSDKEYDGNWNYNENTKWKLNTENTLGGNTYGAASI